jgi:hypothetical protein
LTIKRVFFSVIFLLFLTVGGTEALITGELTSLVSKKRWSLPDKSHTVFLAIGFDPVTQHQLEAGMLVVQSLKQEKLLIAEIPVVEMRYKPYEGAIRGFMKQQVKHKPFLDSIYPYFSDAKTLKASLGLKPDEKMLFVLINEEGKVLWQRKTVPTLRDVDALKGLLP